MKTYINKLLLLFGYQVKENSSNSSNDDVEKEVQQCEKMEKVFPSSLTRDYEKTLQEQTFVTRKEDMKEFLFATSQANLSYMFVTGLRIKVQETPKKEEKKEKSFKQYEDPLLQYIHERLVQYLPPYEIWKKVNIKICDDMEWFRFAQVDSVRNHKAYVNQAKAHENVSLLKHTYHLVKLLHEDIQKNKDHSLYISQYSAHLVLLSAIFHDFGKSDELLDLLEIYNNDRLYHAQASSLYITRILRTKYLKTLFGPRIKHNNYIKSGLEELIQIAQAVNDHHNDQVEPNTLTQFLVQLDRDAKQYEVDLYNQAIKDKK